MASLLAERLGHHIDIPVTGVGVRRDAADHEPLVQDVSMILAPLLLLAGVLLRAEVPFSASIGSVLAQLALTIPLGAALLYTGRLG